MNELDDTILEFFDDLGTPQSEPVVMAPKDVWINIAIYRKRTEKADNTVSRRMGRLEEMGLLALATDTGKHYYLTDRGRAYLTGELDASELEKE